MKMISASLFITQVVFRARPCPGGAQIYQLGSSRGREETMEVTNLTGISDDADI
jgi:hypothetical protein